jgi:hypothetical protein
MKRLKSKKLIARSEKAHIDFIKPSPAAQSIPDWYKRIPAVNEENLDLTIKKCVPVMDGFTSGYIFKTSSDVMYDSETERFMDNSTTGQVTVHPDFQIENIDLDPSLSPHPYKWVNNFYIKTPKGYSTLFVHPLNRFDLPFQTISAIVDTDDFPLTVQFPFFIRKDFSGLIPAGTPIIQAIPFKRDNWNLEFPNEDESYVYKDQWKWFDPPMAKYKRFFWKKKRYQ